MLLFTCVPCVFMSHFGRDLNQSGDGLPRRFEMLSYLFIGCVKDATITSQAPLLLTINSRGDTISGFN